MSICKKYKRPIPVLTYFLIEHIKYEIWSPSEWQLVGLGNNLIACVSLHKTYFMSIWSKRSHLWHGNGQNQTKYPLQQN